MTPTTAPLILLLTFPVLFVGLWLAIGLVLGVMSGWNDLALAYPDRDDEVVRRFTGRSGAIGAGVNINGVLELTVCREGLRLAVSRLFLPFWRPIFVPWREITVERRTMLFWPMARLQFGGRAGSALTLRASLANLLARTAGGAWPEAGDFPSPDRGALLTRAVIEWVLLTGLAAAFFTLAPWAASGGRVVIPPAVTLGFPAVVLGLAVMIQYVRQRDD